MKKICLLLFLFTAMNMQAQEIINLVLVGPKGITKDLDEASSFIIVKQYPDHFVRLDYKKFGPLAKSRSYKDAELKVLHGNYYEYRTNGQILYAGKYEDGKKNGIWYRYNDSIKISLKIIYEDGIPVDTIEINKQEELISYDDEKEANFPGGEKAWVKYLVKSLTKSETANRTQHGGKVLVQFVVGPDGLVHTPSLLKSVEFSVDEDSLKIISNSPKWNAAWQNGIHVNAYRIQPITYAVQDQ